MTQHALAPGDSARPGAVTYVVSCGLDIGFDIASGLCGTGATVAWMTDARQAAEAPVARGITRITTRFDSRASMEAAFRQAAERVGPADQVVHSAIPLVAIEPRELATMADEDWSSACHAAMKATLYCLQAAHAQMAARGGSIVVLGPSLSLAGAAGLVALSTAAEGQRGLVKSSARQWGSRGLTVNWIALAPVSLAPVLSRTDLPLKPDPVPVALARRPAVSEVLPLIEFLASSAGRSMTGATLMLDGGEWMVP
ncbi:MAG TPA: SDR family oxidoreductase [Burkholderiaceae bacterium]|jgi:NAD(P)-dependent dehydrogenase (short-subunit alcohol dehydrogenase family)|nr:SDR family oxidoreductase [Burkholderiaceae bacterium]